MSSLWAKKRKLIISSSVLIPLLIVILFIYLSGREAPNCFDGKLNQDERGIDCGGSCVAVCQNEAEDIAILWTRFLPIVDDVYSVVAMIENPNISLEAENASYTFKLYDERNVLIYERKGSFFIPSGSVVPVFEHALRTGERAPSRATFELAKAPFWEASPERDVSIRIVSKNLDESSSFPKLVSVVKNTSLEDITDISFVALLFDEEENLLNASKTSIESLRREESDTLVFTWPNSFESKVVKIEIVPVAYTLAN